MGDVVGTHARLAAYLATIASAGITLAIGVVFVVVCSAMLWWIDDPVSPAAVLWAASQSFWAWGLYAWLAAGYLLIEPPTSMTLEDALGARSLADPLEARGSVAVVLAFRIPCMVLATLTAWGARTRYTRPLNGLLGVAAGISVVAFLLAILARLSALSPL
ncbi:MAG TPA: hypothetical protein VLH75_04065 [Longimicrobiales bacterium]|nr:hypothetical protein [Longimicrobiales bacterium]